jgi:hypothetical protein
MTNRLPLSFLIACRCAPAAPFSRHFGIEKSLLCGFPRRGSPVQKLLGQVILAALLSLPAYAIEYENKIETVQNAGNPPVDILQDTVEFRPLGESESTQPRHAEARVSRKVEQVSRIRAANHSHPRSAASVRSPADVKSPVSSDTNAAQAPLAYESGNGFQNPFAGLAKIFGSGDN